MKRRRRKKLIVLARAGKTKPTQLRTRQPYRYSAEDKIFYVACGVFLFGVALGAVLVSLNNNTLLEYLSYLAQDGVEARTTGAIFSTFISCLIPHLALLLLCCLFANCTFGMPVIISLVIFKGASAGMMGGYIYRTTGAAGILFNLLILMPPVLMAAIGFLRLSVTGVKSSVTLHKMASKGGGSKIKETNAELYHTLATAAMLACGASILEAVLYKLLGGLFL